MLSIHEGGCSAAWMTLQEKLLYHQIHPVKLATDAGAGIIALWLLWRHLLIPALFVSVVPSIIVSAILIRWADLERYRASRAGRYVRRYMTRRMEALRLLGFGGMGVGAWFHQWWLIGIGLLAIVVAWARGILVPRRD